MTEAANSVLMFEAGEQAAFDIRTNKIDDIIKEFEKINISLKIEVSEKKITFHIAGFPLNGNKCKYCDLFRGFFGGLAKKHLDARYYCKKGSGCITEGGNQCIFVAELIE